jgi:hypothetical protein
MIERKRVRYVACLVAVAVLYLGESVRAQQTTPKFTSTTLTPFTPTFAEFQVFNHLTQTDLQQVAPGYPGPTWTAMEQTKGPSDLYIQTNTWDPGASTGWHRHPGFSLIVITSGTVVQYHADCVPQVYGPNTPNGPTLIDSGDDEHLIRNEDGLGAKGYAVQIVAHTAPRKIVESAPDTCTIQ